MQSRIICQQLAGFGKSSNNTAAEVLSSVRVPFENSTACVKRLSPSHRLHVTEDKFCAGSYYGQFTRWPGGWRNVVAMVWFIYC